MEKEKVCIVMGAGDFTPTDINIGEGDLCIAVDGGYLYCLLQNIKPDIIIGDFDSVEEETRDAIHQIQETGEAEVIVLNPQKDETDMLAALKTGIERGYNSFRIYGAMGGRLEHSIANIQCLTYLKNHAAKGYIMDANVMVTVIRNEQISFNRSMEGFLSVFSLEKEAVGVTIKGMKYLLKDALLTNAYPVGISNEFIGEEGSVSVEEGTLLLIIMWEM